MLKVTNLEGKGHGFHKSNESTKALSDSLERSVRSDSHWIWYGRKIHLSGLHTCIKSYKKLRLPILMIEKLWSIVQITEYEKDKFHTQDNCKGQLASSNR